MLRVARLGVQDGVNCGIAGSLELGGDLVNDAVQGERGCYVNEEAMRMVRKKDATERGGKMCAYLTTLSME
jgi:hypothetical protein